MTSSPSEQTPLLSSSTPLSSANTNTNTSPLRAQLHDFLEAQTRLGQWYEYGIISLIVLNVLAFIFGTLFVSDDEMPPWADPEHGMCPKTTCDKWFIGNYVDNGLDAIFHIGATSILELVTVAVFSVEYGLRWTVADLESPLYQGWYGRIRYYLPSFFSLVDLASIVPFYIDSLVLRHTDLESSSFLRMFRLLRMLRAQGRYDTALTMVDDVYQQQKGILGVALFVGVTTWMSVSALYYLTERRNLDMIYCPTCIDEGDSDLDTSQCTLDVWGLANCTLAGCPGTPEDSHPCYNLYESIPMASYYALLNLFGEFPLMEQHSFGGKIVGTLTAVLAAAVFAIPVGIIGNGFETVIEQKRIRNNQVDAPIVEPGGMTPNHRPAAPHTLRARLYTSLHAMRTTTEGAVVPVQTTVDAFINTWIVVTAVAYMLGTTSLLSEYWKATLDKAEVVAVVIFSIEYGLRVYSSREDPKYDCPGGRLLYMTTFLAVVDFLSFAPFWIVCWTGGTNTYMGDTIISSLRLLRILRFERYTHAFTSFDDVVRRYADVLFVTAFTAVLIWVFFSAFLYLSERNNPDPEMASNYKSVPDSMWMTLLNLSGESPLCQYSAAGKVATGLLGLFATGVVGIPIGLLGAGFAQVINEENRDNQEEDEVTSVRDVSPRGSPLEQAAYQFVNGMGSQLANWFDLTVYWMIFVAVAVGVWQTVDGHENDFAAVEWIAVIFFTVEYVIRLVGAGADPACALESGNNHWLSCRLRYVCSFYSVVDLCSIVPFYVALALPHSIISEYADLLRILRIIRLVKLDNRIPSISLIDDVIRLKFDSLRVAFYAALTLWVLFSALLYLCEHRDTSNEVDPLPQYGCPEDCTMTDRFQTYFDSMIYTAIHLTGDYPITTYSWPARFVNFFMVIAAVGVVSIPSGLIASGFVEIVQSKNKTKQGNAIPSGGKSGDDWYEVRFRGLEGVEPPPSQFGPTVDRWQHAVNHFLNGARSADGHHQWSTFGGFTRLFLFSVIISNIVAVLAESVPAIDRAIGNEPGNFFDRFEVFSVFVFALEYILRLFCAPKNREALYSSFIYATTFFGIVDLLSTAPWFVQQVLVKTGTITSSGDAIQVFRCFRIFRLLQLEDFVTAFSKLDNVFRASNEVLKATGLLALIIWVGCGGLFYIFEENNPNWRECADSIPLERQSIDEPPGCFDFHSTADCNEYYPGMCSQKAFTDMPNALFFTAVFLGGEWGVVDFTWPGRMVCLFLCVVGIGLYAIPVGTLLDSFGAVLGLGGDDDGDDDDLNDDKEA